METNIDNNQNASLSDKSGRAKLWWGLIPLLGLCTLTVCAAGGGILLWRTLTGPETETNPVVQVATAAPETTSSTPTK